VGLLTGLGLRGFAHPAKLELTSVKERCKSELVHDVVRAQHLYFYSKKSIEEVREYMCMRVEGK
jgi:hypothetical protein